MCDLGLQSSMDFFKSFLEAIKMANFFSNVNKRSSFVAKTRFKFLILLILEKNHQGKVNFGPYHLKNQTNFSLRKKIVMFKRCNESYINSICMRFCISKTDPNSLFPRDYL